MKKSESALRWELRRERQYNMYRPDRREMTPAAAVVVLVELVLLGLVFAALVGAVLDWI